MARLPISDWKFLTNHALVLSWITQHPQTTARETAIAIGITERTELKIIGELDSSGYITRRRRGRRNVYRVNPNLPMREETQKNVMVGDLLGVIAPKRAKRGVA